MVEIRYKHSGYKPLISSIKTRNPNFVPIGTKFGFLNCGGAYLFHSEGELGEFIAIYIDGIKLIQNEDFTLESGSTKITILEETFGDEEEGDHTIAAEFRVNGDKDGEMKRVVQNYSLEELKKLNAGDLAAAQQGERHIQVTERNWTAVLSLLKRISDQQLDLLEAFDSLLTKGEAQAQLDDLYTEAESSTRQAGSMSESFASGAERLTTSTQTLIGKMEDSAKRSLENMVRETNGNIYELTQESRRRLVTQSMVTVTLTVLSIVLATLFALWKVR